MTKKCKKCGQTLEIKAFRRDIHSLDGHVDICRTCESEFTDNLSKVGRQVHIMIDF